MTVEPISAEVPMVVVKLRGQVLTSKETLQRALSEQPQKVTITSHQNPQFYGYASEAPPGMVFRAIGYGQKKLWSATMFLEAAGSWVVV